MAKAVAECRTTERQTKIKTPILAAYIAKQSEIAKRLPDSVQTLFHGVVAEIQSGNRIKGSEFAYLRFTRTTNLVEHLGMDLDAARAINAADMAEYQAASAEYQAAKD